MVSTMTKCKGCGITIQNSDIKKEGYTTNLDNKLCVRCFKLKNYNVLISKGVKIDNNKILATINKKNIFVLYLVDFLNLDLEVINMFKAIKSKKALIITKSDTIPKNIIKERLVLNIKKVYDIKEDIILCSSKLKKNINEINNICLKEEKVLLAGFTNAGKSSLINTLLKSDITVSKKENTTQDFITIKNENLTIVDAPGFMSDVKRDSIPKNFIKPRTYQLKCKYYLNILDIKLNCKSDANITIYINNDIIVERRKERENVNCNILVKKNCDLVLKGIGFIKFSTDTYISINTKNYEIRNSIIGGSNE